MFHGGEFISQSSITFAIRGHLHPHHHPPPAPSPPSSRRKRRPKISHWGEAIAIARQEARWDGGKGELEVGAGGGTTGGSCGHPVLCKAAQPSAVVPGGAALRAAASPAGCWCPAPAPSPSRGRCAQQPRTAGALCPLRRRAAGRRRRHRDERPSLYPPLRALAQEACRRRSTRRSTRATEGSRKNSWHRSAPHLSVQNTCVCMPASITASRMCILVCCTEQSAHCTLSCAHRHLRAPTPPQLPYSVCEARILLELRREVAREGTEDRVAIALVVLVQCRFVRLHQCEAHTSRTSCARHSTRRYQGNSHCSARGYRKYHCG